MTKSSGTAHIRSRNYNPAADSNFHAPMRNTPFINGVSQDVLSLRSGGVGLMGRLSRGSQEAGTTRAQTS